MFVKIGLELRKEEDIGKILLEVASGNIVIFNCGYLIAFQMTQQLEILMDKLVKEAKRQGFELGSLGTFRGIIAPKDVRIWRWK